MKWQLISTLMKWQLIITNVRGMTSL